MSSHWSIEALFTTVWLSDCHCYFWKLYSFKLFSLNISVYAIVVLYFYECLWQSGIDKCIYISIDVDWYMFKCIYTQYSFYSIQATCLSAYPVECVVLFCVDISRFFLTAASNSWIRFCILLRLFFNSSTSSCSFRIWSLANIECTSGCVDDATLSGAPSTPDDFDASDTSNALQFCSWLLWTENNNVPIIRYTMRHEKASFCSSYFKRTGKIVGIALLFNWSRFFSLSIISKSKWSSHM